ncbi:MAG: hypothetical protein WC847_00900 [Candidatus Paceibacterota bacterium]|jgi:hypothetical protein
MSVRNFPYLVRRGWGLGKFICIELDEGNSSNESCYLVDVKAKNLEKVEATKNFACLYKLNVMSFLKHGKEGLSALYSLIEDIKCLAPNIPIILEDCNSPETAFDYFKADAVIVNPYPGIEMLTHFTRDDKGVFVICRAFDGKFQETDVRLFNEEQRLFFEGRLEREEWPCVVPAYDYVAHSVINSCNPKMNCGLVMNARNHNDLTRVRLIVGGEMPILATNISKNESEIIRTILAGKSRSQGIILMARRDMSLDEIEDLHFLINFHVYS